MTDEPTPPPLWRRATRVLLSAARRQRGRAQGRPWRSRLLTTAICLVAGVMISVSAINARGTDLRPARNTDLVELVRAEARHNADLQVRLAAARSEVDILTAEQQAEVAPADHALADDAGVSAVSGPAVSVSLTDAPLDVAPVGVDGDLLVVHQQDIQAVVNALWQGGAEAITIQGQRVVSTTGIKCVGNTVVLHGVPYAPPYTITAIGDPTKLEASLSASPYLQIYQEYVRAYRLGYEQRRERTVTMPPFEGSTTLRYATPLPTR